MAFIVNLGKLIENLYMHFRNQVPRKFTLWKVCRSLEIIDNTTIEENWQISINVFFINAR